MSIDIKDLGPEAQKQAIEQLSRRQAAAKKPKYHNTPTVRTTPSGDQIRFDSTKEARRYDELMFLLRDGKIRDLKLQPEWTLQEAYTTPEGVRVRAIRYRADFSYTVPTPPGTLQPTERLIVEDVKSKATKTRVYAMKKKMLLEKYKIRITEV